jgi:hypothetical protein
MAWEQQTEMTRQVETATVVGSITGTGNTSVIVTSGRMSSSPKTLSVAVTNGDNASAVASAIRSAMAFDDDVSDLFRISGSGADIILTRRVSEANDTTLNVSIANGTCTGLTTQATSVSTTAGSGLDNAYCTLDQYKGYQNITNVNPTDDVFIEYAINAASRWVDTQTKTRFYAATETRLFDAPANGKQDYIVMDMYLLSVDAIVNGNGLTLSASDYYLKPNNAPNKSAIYIGPSLAWYPASTGSLVQAISVTGSYGYSATPPSDIFMACMELAKCLYGRRNGENMSTQSIVTAAGVIQIPGGTPTWVADVLASYRRIGV